MLIANGAADKVYPRYLLCINSALIIQENANGYSDSV
jgi:hypothetical protein